MTAQQMKPNPLKQRIRDGHVALSTMSSLTDPAVVEILARAGFDGVIIEMEHMPIDLGRVRELVLVAELAGIASQVRIGLGEWATVQQLLEIGLQGVQVAHVRTREDAEEAVNAVRYPPIGRRGALATSRAAGYGDVGWAEHVRTANEEVFLNLMIEDAEGLDNLDAIASTDGVDVITIGPHDLAESLGVGDQPGHPRLRSAVDDVSRLLRAKGKARLGLSIGHPLLPMTVETIRALGVVHSNVLPSVERHLLNTLRQRVGDLRDSEAIVRQSLQAAPSD